jgi:hypothetical protein
MKNWPALAVTGALAASLLAATPAVAADPAPTNLKISWKDDTFSAVHVTWDEEGSQPNRIVLHRDGAAIPERLQLIPADAPNAVDIAARDLPGLQVTQIGVAAGTAAGSTSPMALSPEFDSQRASAPVLISNTISGANAVTVRWRAATPVDTSPGDPLDRTAPPQFQAEYQVRDTAGGVPIGGSGTATQLTVTPPARPYALQVRQVDEWGVGSIATVLKVNSSAPTLRVPAWARYEDLLEITGTVNGDFRPVILQARNTPTSPWYVVATTASSGNFFFDLVRPGVRQYRVQVPNSVTGNAVWFGAYSSVATSTIQLNTYGIFQADPIRRGQLGHAHVTVSPAADTTAVLQRWNGKIWTTVGPVAVRGGRGVGYVRAVTVGRVAYRYYVPATVYRGATYQAAYSPNFILTTA